MGFGLKPDDIVSHLEALYKLAEEHAAMVVPMTIPQTAYVCTCHADLLRLFSQHRISLIM
jgi:hypothetical protein